MGKDDLLNKGAILQRDEETYAVMAKAPGGRDGYRDSQKGGGRGRKVRGQGP